ncbi:hypothetical protein BOSEA31B_14852 [Hyphomicrobiales bacterium]|nr:hypothetical protein BOSEA31B_14852 [Hyphomicrobiales bacterium]CAH1701341.1 hypothetical protein BOSEA1005_21041 [Hyphomicrobiales bacterium]
MSFRDTPVKFGKLFVAALGAVLTTVGKTAENGYNVVRPA